MLQNWTQVNISVCHNCELLHPGPHFLCYFSQSTLFRLSCCHYIQITEYWATKSSFPYTTDCSHNPSLWRKNAFTYLLPPKIKLYLRGAWKLAKYILLRGCGLIISFKDITMPNFLLIDFTHFEFSVIYLFIYLLIPKNVDTD